MIILLTPFPLNCPRSLCMTPGGGSSTATKTCQNRCGNPFDRNFECQCNKACTNHNDCCPDFNNLCNNGRNKNPIPVSDEELKTISNQLFQLGMIYK